MSTTHKNLTHLTPMNDVRSFPRGFARYELIVVDYQQSPNTYSLGCVDGIEGAERAITSGQVGAHNADKLRVVDTVRGYPVAGAQFA